MSERRKFIQENKLKDNYTTIFLLPMLEYDKDFFPEEFISAYLIDVLEPQIACIFENSDSEDLKEVLDCIQNHTEFVSIEYGDDNKEVICKLKIPKEYKIDFNLFKIGRYSKFSNVYKEILLDTHGRITGAGKCIMMVDALFPDHLAKKFRADKMSALYPGSTPVSINDLPGGEVMSVPNWDEELYQEIDKFKTNKHLVEASK